MKSLLLSALLLLAVSLQAQAPSTNPVPLKEEPHHHLLFENEYVRAWGFSLPGKEATLLHSHDLPYIGVTLGATDFINAVVGKPETHVAFVDAQVGYSKGGFAHTVRTDAGTPFRNFTIELLKPQGTAQNRCVKVIADGPLDCPQASSTPLGAATTLVFETEEMAMQTGEVSFILRIAGADTKPAHLVGVLENSTLNVEVPGQPPKTLHGGEAVWLPAGTAANLVDPAPGSARFILLTFKDSVPKS